jgi:hypothetical protein
MLASSHPPEQPFAELAAAVAVAEHTSPRWARSPNWEGMRQTAPQPTSIYSSLKFPVTEQ